MYIIAVGTAKLECTNRLTHFQIYSDVQIAGLGSQSPFLQADKIWSYLCPMVFLKHELQLRVFVIAKFFKNFS
jgi:hypothetical protein